MFCPNILIVFFSVGAVQQDSPSLAPVISHVKKKIAKTLGADSSSNDYLEDSMRKVNKYVRNHNT